MARLLPARYRHFFALPGELSDCRRKQHKREHRKKQRRRYPDPERQAIPPCWVAQEPIVAPEAIQVPTPARGLARFFGGSVYEVVGQAASAANDEDVGSHPHRVPDIVRPCGSGHPPASRALLQHGVALSLPPNTSERPSWADPSHLRPPPSRRPDPRPGDGLAVPVRHPSRPPRSPPACNYDTINMKRGIKMPFGGKPKLKDIAVFSRQFATMINSGLSLLRSLYILAEQTENKELSKVVDQVRQDVERGASLSQALSRHPKVFNRLYVAMVRAGETGGVLDSVLLQTASIIEKQVELRRKIKSAMTYPTVVFCLCLLIVAAMLLFIVPTFKSIYAQLGGTLPALTRILIAISTAFKKFFPVFIVLGGIGIWGFRRWIQTDAGRAVWDRVKLKTPVFGKLVHKTALTRFSQTLAVLMRSGVPILESLEITSETVNNTVLSDAVKDVQAGVKVGEAMAKPLATTRSSRLWS